MQRMTAASAVADLGIMMLHSFSICFSPLVEVWVWEDLCLDTVDITQLEVDSTLTVIVEVGVVVTVVSSGRRVIINSCIIHLRYLLASSYHYYEVNKKCTYYCRTKSNLQPFYVPSVQVSLCTKYFSTVSDQGHKTLIQNTHHTGIKIKLLHRHIVTPGSNS